MNLTINVNIKDSTKKSGLYFVTFKIGNKRQRSNLSGYKIGNDLLEVDVCFLLIVGLECNYFDNKQYNVAYVLAHLAFVRLTHHHRVDGAFGQHFQRLASSRQKVKLNQLRIHFYF